MKKTIALMSFSLILIALLGSSKVLAHCDTMDGPVVKAAQKALETGDVNLVLVWVQPPYEAEVKKAFDQAAAVRKLSLEAKELADRYFFETFVRLHRAGEGEPYTGVKPAGTDLGPVIPAADKALETGSATALLELVAKAVKDGVLTRFNEAKLKKNYKPGDLAAGRAYVAAYVEFLHYVERVFDAASGPAHGHGAKEGEAGEEGGH